MSNTASIEVVDIEVVDIVQTSMKTSVMGSSDLDLIGDVELVEELSLLTTQAARMRARMADIMAELDRRRQRSLNASAVGSRTAGSW